MAKKLRALLTGFFHETNTYVKPGTIDSFIRAAGQEITDQNRGLNTVYSAYIDYCEKNDVEIVGGVSWWGNPCGLLNNKDYQTMKAEILDAAKKAGDIDLLMLNFHGAARVDGVSDPELEMVTSLKEILGDKLIVLAFAMDLHGKCSDEFNKACDLISSVHKYPHIDYYERATETLALLPGYLDGSLKVTRHVEYLPLIFGPLNTMKDLGAGVLAKLKSIMAKPEILDISYMHGFPYADHKFTGGYVIVTTNNDMDLAKKEAVDFSKWVWDQREALNAPAMNIEEAAQAVVQELQTTEDYKPRPKIDLDKLANDKVYQDTLIDEAKDTSWGFVPDWTHKPVVVSDIADNPGGGTGGCGTHVLRRFMEENIDRMAFIGLTCPKTAKKAHEAGVGAVIDVEMAGKPVSGLDIDGEPIKAKAYVKMLADGHTMNRLVQAGRTWDVGLTTTLIIGGLTITVTSIAWQGWDNAMTLIGGIDPKDYKVVIVKSSAHYRAYYTPIADKIFEADGPGGTTTNVTNFHPKHLRGSLYPWDLKTKYPS